MELRSEISKKYLAEALIKLMKQKKFDKITNKDITNKAGLSDITIYRNFNSKEEIVKYYLSNIFTTEKKEWKEKENVGFQIFSFFQKNKELIELLYKANLQYLLIDNILNVHDYKKEDPNIIAYSKVTVAYLIFGWCDEWYKRGMVETPEEMMKYFKQTKKQ
ncbi:MAG: TetR/AcrR family transcriptional regulator [Bacilli bacterium]|nr:TetR/AcrR family transcriptional regulator [Bacilli bacterium]